MKRVSFSGIGNLLFTNTKIMLISILSRDVTKVCVIVIQITINPYNTQDGFSPKLPQGNHLAWINTTKPNVLKYFVLILAKIRRNQSPATAPKTWSVQNCKCTVSEFYSKVMRRVSSSGIGNLLLKNTKIMLISILSREVTKVFVIGI